MPTKRENGTLKRAKRYRSPVRALDETDIQIIIGLALGWPQKRIGEWVRTPLHPAGIGPRAIQSRVADFPDEYERSIAKASEALRREKQQFEDITRGEYIEKIAKLRHKAVQVKELVLDQAMSNSEDADFLKLGLQASDSIEDRDLGRAKQVVSSEFSGRMEYVWTAHTRAELLGQEMDMRESENLLLSAPADAIEAEILGENGGDGDLVPATIPAVPVAGGAGV